MLIASKRKKKINELKLQLSECFEMKELRCAKKILGMEITSVSDHKMLFLMSKFGFDG